MVQPVVYRLRKQCCRQKTVESPGKERRQLMPEVHQDVVTSSIQQEVETNEDAKDRPRIAPGALGLFIELRWWCRGNLAAAYDYVVATHLRAQFVV